MEKMAMTRKGLLLLLAGVVVMIAGYMLMTGPTPVREVFNYDMFDFRRTVAAPIVIVAGIIVVAVAIMRPQKDGKTEEK